jgi:hypothetical protein
MSTTFAHPTVAGFAPIAWLHTKMAGKTSRARPVVYPTSTEMHFERSQIRELLAPLGVTVECASGQVWITMDHDPRDVLLEPGQTFTLDRDERTLIMALEKASVRCNRLSGI